MKTTTQTKEARERHHAALLALAKSLNPGNRLTGLHLWRKLRRLEVEAGNAATAQCNGAPYLGQPYREEAAWDEFKDGILEKVAAIFGGKLPPGFFLNTDPRGYALKLHPVRGRTATRFSLEQDWGGNQILAPVIED